MVKSHLVYRQTRSISVWAHIYNQLRHAAGYLKTMRTNMQARACADHVLRIKANMQIRRRSCGGANKDRDMLAERSQTNLAIGHMAGMSANRNASNHRLPRVRHQTSSCERRSVAPTLRCTPYSFSDASPKRRLRLGQRLAHRYQVIHRRCRVTPHYHERPKSMVRDAVVHKSKPPEEQMGIANIEDHSEGGQSYLARKIIVVAFHPHCHRPSARRTD